MNKIKNLKVQDTQFWVSLKNLQGAVFGGKREVKHNTGLGDFFLLSHCEITKVSLAAYSNVTVQ